MASGLNRLGVVNGAAFSGTAEEFALFQKEYTVDLIAAFQENTVFNDRITRRQLTEGTGAVFPVSWKTDAQYFIPGVTADMGGTNKMNQNELFIAIDRLLTSDILVSQMDELMAHMDLRQERAKQQGAAIARKLDKSLAALNILASRATANVTGAPTGGAITTASMDTDKDVLLAAITAAVEKLTENDVPMDVGDVSAYFKPAQYFLLLASDRIVNRDFGGIGSLGTGKVGTYMGCDIVMSNNMPNGVNVSADSGELNTYNGDFTKTVGVVSHRTAVGGVQLLSLQFESDWKLEKQATLFVAKMAVGHNVTRPEAAVELKKT